MLAAVGPDDYVVALEIAGKAMSTEQLSAWLAERLRDGAAARAADRRSRRPVAAMPGPGRSQLVACRR